MYPQTCLITLPIMNPNISTSCRLDDKNGSLYNDWPLLLTSFYKSWSLYSLMLTTEGRTQQLFGEYFFELNCTLFWKDRPSLPLNHWTVKWSGSPSYHCQLCQVQRQGKSSSTTTKTEGKCAWNLHLGRLYTQGERHALQTSTVS